MFFRCCGPLRLSLKLRVVLTTLLSIYNRVKSLMRSTFGHCFNIGSTKGVLPKRNNVLSHFSDALFIVPIFRVFLRFVFWRDRSALRGKESCVFRAVVAFVVIFDVLIVVRRFNRFCFTGGTNVLIHRFTVNVKPGVFSRHGGKAACAVQVLPVNNCIQVTNVKSRSARLGPNVPLGVALSRRRRIVRVSLDGGRRLRTIPVRLLRTSLRRTLFVGKVVPKDSRPIECTMGHSTAVVRASKARIRVTPVSMRCRSTPLLGQVLAGFTKPVGGFVLNVTMFVTVTFIRNNIAMGRDHLKRVRPSDPTRTTKLQRGSRMLTIGNSTATS